MNKPPGGENSEDSDEITRRTIVTAFLVAAGATATTLALGEVGRPTEGESLRTLSAVREAAKTVAQAGEHGQRVDQRVMVKAASTDGRALVVDRVDMAGQKDGSDAVAAVLEAANANIFQDEDPAISRDSINKARPAILLLTATLNADAFEDAKEFQHLCQDYMEAIRVQPGQTLEEVQKRQDDFAQHVLKLLGAVVENKANPTLQYLRTKDA